MNAAPAGISKRHEVLVLPGAVLVLVVLSVFTLISYRETVRWLVTERRQEAAALAAALAREFAGGSLPRDHELNRRRGVALAVAVLDADGYPLVASGLVAPLSVGELEAWDDLASGVVSATAPLRLSRRRLTLQVDLPAARLLSAVRGLGVLTPVVLVIDAALILLVGLYLRHFLAPFDRLIERARAAGRMPETTDELAFLIATFEETMEGLTAPQDELGTLEKMLSRSIESGLLLLDPGGCVLALNKLGAALLEVEPPAPGTPLAELLADHPEPRRILAEALGQQRRLERRELTLGQTGNGEERVLGLTLHPLRREDESLRGYLAFFVDLTAVRRQAEERRLAESLRHIGELSAGLAHEMRNSLATLRGYLGLLERGAGKDAATSEYTAEIRHETDHLQRVIDDFLSFARPGSTRMEEVDLERLLHRSAADPALDGMPVRFAGELAGAVVTGDAQLLERALRNLLHNAAEAERGAGGEGPIEVVTRRDMSGIEITVNDRGPGLPEEIRERLFHPFASHRPGGVGLGLALTRRIVELHGGSIRLDEREDGGVAANVRLPFDASVTDRNEPSSSEPPP